MCFFLHPPNGFLTSSETELNSRVFCEKLDGPSGISFRRASTGHGDDSGFHGTVDFACGIVRIHIAIQDQRALKPALTVKLDDIADHLQRHSEIIRTVTICGVGIRVTVQCQQDLAALLDGVARLARAQDRFQMIAFLVRQHDLVLSAVSTHDTTPPCW